jgi:tetratricopeptide (TPR) repeat protein
VSSVVQDVLASDTIPTGVKLLTTFLLISTLAAPQEQAGDADVVRQGSALTAGGKLEEARVLYQNALLHTPANPILLFELGMIDFRQRDWDRAIETFTESLKADPGNIKTLFYLSEAYFARPDLDHARETIAKAAQIDPNDAQVCQKYGEYLTATLETRRAGISWLEKARRLNPALENVDFEIGKAQFELTDFQSASKSLESAVRREHKNGDASFLLAESWSHLGDWQKARSYYEDSLTRGYVDAHAYYGLGQALVQLGKFQAAIEPLRHALELQPSMIQAHFQLGKAYRETGLSTEGRHETKLFAAMNGRTDTSSELKTPENQKAWQRVRPLLENGHEQEAREYLAGINAPQHLDSSQVDFLLGAMYFSMGRNAEAQRVLALARAQDPRAAHIAAYLGMVQISSGDKAAAEAAFRAALELDPFDPLALIGMGSLRYQQAKWAEAVEYLEKSRTADPGVLFMLCDAYFKVGRNQDGTLTAEMVRAFGSKQKELMAALDNLLQSQHPEQAVSPR